MSKKIAVILSGCGVYDGAEIHESVITLLRLDQRGAEVQCFAPNISQLHVINHLTGDEMPESRNVLVESARIARGNIKDIREASVEDFDALIVPGGFGAAKNLSNFAIEGAGCTVQPDVLALTEAFAEAGKPVGLMCISPALAAKIYGPGVTCTIGSDADTAAAMNKMGATHQDCAVSDIVEDKARKLVCTPAYMLAQSISEAASGINKLVDRVLELTHENDA
ncbi:MULTISPECIES: isoprenoid biosynthesis glyoxalase ElbB [Pseudomonas]|jgi:enhancing lycopene biosynthesis protein 2|uniref:Glyoxalase n=2 Tax=Pseudomonas fluorescens group TaxID=136843 RepID=A0AB36CUV0_9PSED|nr:MULTISPECIES: isoprenoid biosynthesis glyoxalase ElbB [Pseudomonas]MBU0524325.1 isoprenoid biosynthesis glyoxalase ElbB [Gammaproteobacteria bacterium]MDF9884191.1 enhancing lycopene biosynthesis protein 2 [Pseudomonas silensiensis]MBU0820265.1 isoprenoid biosynthesis glyoxalase ElbB [Gammaproteobacteria bacterium]MBU0841669.1 isoprenoid biosynthesis glyoxalase ElbB [Gammaproteobacteria bacterium]MBU1841293.1 isoprenoid biosynthesis glyoxalase ElbB [Gammaproteobacteria bacterium]